jgi:hypothetical protein
MMMTTVAYTPCRGAKCLPFRVRSPTLGGSPTTAAARYTDNMKILPNVDDILAAESPADPQPVVPSLEATDEAVTTEPLAPKLEDLPTPMDVSEIKMSPEAHEDDGSKETKRNTQATTVTRREKSKPITDKVMITFYYLTHDYFIYNKRLRMMYLFIP